MYTFDGVYQYSAHFVLRKDEAAFPGDCLILFTL